MADIRLRVNGREFAGWKSARVTRGIEAIAGGFELDVSDRWATQSKPWQIFEEDECTLYMDGEVVVTGYVDRRSLSYTSNGHSLSVSGRDKTAALVDCSAVLDKWEFRNAPVLTLAKRVAEPFGISVSLQSGLVLPTAPAKLTVDPGDTAFEVIERACRSAALLPVSDGRGGLVLTRAGSGRASTQLVEGQNILEASADYDVSGRFNRYLVLGQHRGNDELWGESAAKVRAGASDPNVRRTSRVLLVRPEGNVTIEHARKRAEWEATVRAARGDNVAVTVQGWTQSDGKLWPVNALVRVHSPLIDIDGDLLISQVTYSLDDSGGTKTSLTLRRPDAFKPEPTVGPSAAFRWKELVKGV